LHRSKAGCGQHSRPFFPLLEDPDEQDDDQNDQENGAESDVHPRLPPFGRLMCSPLQGRQTRVAWKKLRSPRVLSGNGRQTRSPSRSCHASSCRASRGARTAGRRPAARPSRRLLLGRSAYCAFRARLRRWDGEPGGPLLRDRRVDPRRDHAPQVDLVEPLDLSQARPRPQGMRVLAMGHVPLTTTRTRCTPLLHKPS
jgi:hypothetical protein